MKSVVCLIFALLISYVSFSQIAAEWTQQKKTQRNYLIQQIVALQTYLGYVKKGYVIANNGISAVQNIKNGEWRLHKNFFGSLSVVNPKIKKYTKVADIIDMQLKMGKQVKSLINVSKQTGLFTLEEIDYVDRICDHLLSECLKSIEDLIRVATSGELEMKDDERIKRIESIYTEMQDRSTFLLSFGKSITILSKQRMHESSEVELSKKLNGLNP